MKVFISKKYMLFPVNVKAANKKVCFYSGDELVFDLNCKIDNLAPHFTAFIDLSAFMGKELELTIEPQMEYTPRFADTAEYPDLWQEPLRPQVHFTVKNGWNNDPNGLIYANGEYHMFFQHNPAAPEWGNMHWGHAVSRDLVHWEEKDIALFPDKLGTMFSGSAFTDSKNAAGFGKDAMLLFYTAAGGTNLLSKGNKFTQCLAYSTDGGKTFTKYEGNPIVPHREAANRDPKVVYVEEIDKYIMAIYRAEGRYELLSSADLINWFAFCDIPLKGDAECPDIFPLNCEGRKLWVFMGAMDVYVVGYFEADRFVIENTEKKLTYLKMSYAAQSFSGVDNRVLRIAWHILRAPAANFASQMSFPTELTLERIGEKYYLCSAPAREIEQLYSHGERKEDLSLEEGYIANTGACPLLVKLKAPYVAGEKLVLDLFGVELACDMAVNEVRCKGAKMPLSVLGDSLELTVISDKCSLEIFADGGKSCVAVAAFADYNLPRFTVSKNSSVKLEYMEWHALRPIH